MSTPAKLKIIAYKESDFSGLVGAYSAQVNPTTYSVDRTINYDLTRAIGNAGSPTKYKGIEPSTMKFELLFDGTGVIETPGGLPFMVPVEIKAFEAVAYSFDGNIHSPHYLEIYWGSVAPFQCVLTSMSITYKLFTSLGVPLRALMNVTFTSSTPTAVLEQEAGRQSPDLMHVATVKAGDTLPQLTAGVYGDVRYYLEVARYNSIVNIRDLKPGRQIQFPRLN